MYWCDERGEVTSGAGPTMQDILGGTTLTGGIVSPRLLEIVNCSTFVLCSAPQSPGSAPFQAAVFITWNYTDSVQQDLYRIIQILLNAIYTHHLKINLIYL